MYASPCSAVVILVQQRACAMYTLYSPLQCEKSPAMCIVSIMQCTRRSLCRSTHSRHPILRQNVGGNLSICVHSPSLHTLPICQHCAALCVCAAHLSICVDSVAPRAAAPGVVGKAGSGELPAHYQRLPTHLFLSSFHPNVPFRHSIKPLKCS